jgi:hypothetical protein
MRSLTNLGAIGGTIATGIFVLLLRLWFLTPDDMLHAMREVGYWAMWLLVAPGVWMGWRARSRAKNALERFHAEPWWAWGGLCLLLLITLIHEPRLTKINYDEHVLLSISRTMHLEQKAAWVAEAKLIGGSVVPMALIVDKRPVFYPFLLSFIHKVSGYRIENIYLLNGLLCAAFLVFSYLLFRRFGGAVSGLAGATLIASVPLLAQNATAGGFDLLNATLLAALAWSSVRYLEHSVSERLGLMVWLALLLANTRYESALFLLIPTGAFTFVALRERGLPAAGPWIAAAPLGLLPALFANAVFSNHESFFQVPKEAFWSVGHYVSNLEHAVAYMFNFEPGGTNAWWLAALGAFTLPASLLVLRRAWVSRMDTGLYRAFAISTLVVALQVTLILGLGWGRWDDPLVSRFTLPLWWLLAWSAVVCAAHLKQHGVKRAPALLLGGAFFCAVVLGTGRSAYAKDTLSMRLPMALDWTRSRLEAWDPKRRSLVLADSTLPYTNAGFSSNTVEKALINREQLRAAVRYQLYGEIFVVVGWQRALPGGDWEYPDAVGRLMSVARLELDDELMVDAFYKVSIYRIKSLIDDTGVLPWPAPDREGDGQLYRRRVYELMP